MANYQGKDAQGDVIDFAAQGAGTAPDPHRPGRSVADGDDSTQGAIEDAVVAAGASGSISAKLRAISRDLVENIVLKAGAAIIGEVGIDQTTPGTTDSVSVATAQGAGAAIGAVSGAAVVTNANGTIQQYLRGLVTLLAATPRTPTMSRPTTSGSVAAGAQTVAFANVGAVNGTVAGTTLKPGETVEFVTHLNDTLGAIAYNPGASGEFLIAEVR